MAAITDRQDNERRFAAALHGVKLQEHDGRVHGMRQELMRRMKQRGRR